ncbi:MAG: methylmalonyl-CoA epimerase [Syntrophomonadaceae bacterium]|nr:methylmalonyl-CoA epimerase [Syntrophomonadaceae bacterium]
MKVIKIDHIGIAVKDLNAAKHFYEEVLGMRVSEIEEVKEQKVRVAFLPTGDSEIELLESTEVDGPIAKFIEVRGEGLQHIALRVENVQGTINELKEKGIRLIDEVPRYGAGGAKIAFIHPKATFGTLIEICERSN